MPAAPEPANTEVTGKVLSVSAGKAILKLTEGQHPASGFEGESEFVLGKGDSLIVSPGDTIRGQAVPFGGGYRLERIWPADPVAESIMAGVNRQLRRDTVSRGLNPTLKVGETLPDFALYDQNGKVFQSRFLRGNRVLMNFIFTRCAMPMMCPAATQRMVQLQSEAKEAGIKNLKLVSISFDPEFDSPGILREYAQNYEIDSADYILLTGQKRAIKDILKQFGIVATEEGGTINHTMATVLINENGKIVFRRNGSMWTASDFLDRLKSD